MSEIFWNQQSSSQQEEYIQLLKLLGSLSNLFSDSSSPYLYYRGHENLFCESFDAKNLSRGDVSYDAIKDNVGIGIKTFLNNNGYTFQKIAEFNSDSYLIRELNNPKDIIKKIASLRNKRILTTQNMTKTERSIYHLVTREPGKMNIIEKNMELIDLESIQLAKNQNKNTIKFRDKHNDYSFSLSKNTLLQRFDTREDMIDKQFSVDILENPFNLLKNCQKYYKQSNFEAVDEKDYIILPLYSAQQGIVAEKSGLNQWNGEGRKRHPDEVYIPIPSWIHDKFNNFFVYAKNRKTKGQSAKDSPSFDVELPNGEIMKCKVSQDGGKALTSDPNKALGKWILRDVLNIPKNTLVTIEMLRDIDIDSVRLTKKSDSYYLLDFVQFGSFIEFEENNR